ncbi:MAG TPA: apolipoprotein N-acyltransferase [Alphaproteobacteria bacterium]
MAAGASARLAALAAGLAARTGRRRYTLAFFLGVFAAFALPPFYATPLIIPAFTGLLWLFDGVETLRAAVALGWWFGFGFFLTGLYWVGIAMTVDLAQFGWMIPFATGGLSAGMAIYPGLALVSLRLSRAKGLGRVLALALAWTVFEWIRGHALTGFPWNLIGYTWTVADAPIQFASVVGIYGLSLVTVLVAALPAAAGGPGAVRRPMLAIFAAILVVAALWGGGAARLAGTTTATVSGVVLRLVQPNIEQQDKWQPQRVRDNLLATMRLSAGSGHERITDIIWPESSVGPFFLDEDPQLRNALASLVPKGGLLLTGTLRRAPRDDGPGPGGSVFRYFNSLQALDQDGRVVASYDKFHLVPFGEYIPLRGVLPVETIVPGRGDFSAGPGPRTLTLPHLPPVSPLICYEAIFPGRVVEPDHRPDWLLNVTNDAWFGDSGGPYQHFESARMRAVEEGLPLVRAANTGISGVVDPYGRVMARLGLGKAGVVDSPLPQAIAGGTPFSRHGSLYLGIFMALILALAWRLSRAH